MKGKFDFFYINLHFHDHTYTFGSMYIVVFIDFSKNGVKCI